MQDVEIEQRNTRGKVNHFRVDRGFGFIIDSNARELFFHISDVENEEMLKPGYRVVFDSGRTDRGLRAISVRVKERRLEAPVERSDQPDNGVNDGRIQCPACHTWMQPRIITGPPTGFFVPQPWTPEPRYSMCVRCGERIEDLDLATKRRKAQEAKIKAQKPKNDDQLKRNMEALEKPIDEIQPWAVAASLLVIIILIAVSL